MVSVSAKKVKKKFHACVTLRRMDTVQYRTGVYSMYDHNNVCHIGTVQYI